MAENARPKGRARGRARGAALMQEGAAAVPIGVEGGQSHPPEAGEGISGSGRGERVAKRAREPELYHYCQKLEEDIIKNENVHKEVRRELATMKDKVTKMEAAIEKAQAAVDEEEKNIQIMKAELEQEMRIEVDKAVSSAEEVKAMRFNIIKHLAKLEEDHEKTMERLDEETVKDLHKIFPKLR